MSKLILSLYEQKEELLMKLCLSDRDRVGILADCGALLSTNQISLKLYVEVIRKFETQKDFPVVQQLCCFFMQKKKKQDEVFYAPTV